MTAILGISAFYHDSAAALIVDGRVVATAQEERFSRIKHDASFPIQAIEFCLSKAGLTAEDLDHVAFYEKPFLKFERILETYLAHAPAGLGSFFRSMPTWLRSKLYISRVIRKDLKGKFRGRIVFPEHHESHAASAFFASPFQEASILTVDGVGEWATTTLGYGNGNRIEIQKEIRFPDSIGLLYSAFTYFCGFRVNGGEGKLMGLAPYGKPIYSQQIRDNLIDLKPDGSFRLNQTFFDYCVGDRMTSSAFSELFNGPPRKPESAITDRERDMAASVQEVIEDAMLRMANHLHEVNQSDQLCIAGGVGLNCVANGRLLSETKFKDVWVQPAAGDSGGAIGAALFVWHQLKGADRNLDVQFSPFLGPSSSERLMTDVRPSKDNGALHEALANADFNVEQWGEEELLQRTAEDLESGKIVGWFQGRMEFGPRALGNRSILANPMLPDIQERLNSQVKHRESFRPFAPVIIAESASQYFDLDTDSPFMTIAAQVKPDYRNALPGIVHVDGSARVQTVAKGQNDRLHKLLTEFQKIAGHPVLLNTSFNVRGEPIVCNAYDAIACFLNTDLDVLVIDDLYLGKAEQDAPDLNRLPPISRGVTEINAFQKLMSIFQQVTFPIRWLVSRAVLTIIYFVLVTPVGVLWRVQRSRRSESESPDGSSFYSIDRSRQSYWKSRKPAGDSSRYFKQY